MRLELLYIHMAGKKNSKTRFLLYAVYKNQLKMAYKCKCHIKIFKFPEENIGEHLPDLGEDKNFLNREQNHKRIKT